MVLQTGDEAVKSDSGNRKKARLEKEEAELQLMLAELDALLDQQPGSRQTLRHINFVRQALHKKGLRALKKLPLDVLQRSLEQFEGLVSNWSPVGLASLRSKMAVAVIDREHLKVHVRAKAAAETDAYRTTGVIDSLPGIPALPDVHSPSDDEALVAVYAALVSAQPAGTVELQPDWGAKSAKSVAPAHPMQAASTEPVELRVLES